MSLSIKLCDFSGIIDYGHFFQLSCVILSILLRMGKLYLLMVAPKVSSSVLGKSRHSINYLINGQTDEVETSGGSLDKYNT